MFAGTQENRSLEPCGYRLDEHVYFYLEDKILINHSKVNLKRVQLRATMCFFLMYLLSNKEKDCISDDEIMAAVWEENNLRASSNRLWQVARDLKYKLIEVGLEGELFFRKGRKGFAVSKERVLPLYFVTEVYIM
ncbi:MULTISPECIES: hypothetical protein [unclassified Serratia (in: enterobacteria)]|uniref:hypothetical protein n=1 Tax=unclassified Serratia (in: enterobacteria) TaxID=2647522 RepID=UPI00068EA204|nr:MULTISPECIES: hypothetical protein [unclassified Serratia (in: enterobacteria)]